MSRQDIRSDDILAGQLRSSDQALPVTARRAKRENGGLGLTYETQVGLGGYTPQERAIHKSRSKSAFLAVDAAVFTANIQ
jgi:hypothetical protein